MARHCRTQLGWNQRRIKPEGLSCGEIALARNTRFDRRPQVAYQRRNGCTGQLGLLPFQPPLRDDNRYHPIIDR